MDIINQKTPPGNPRVKRSMVTTLRILVPIYLTYALFLITIFYMFIPHQKVQLLEQKKRGSATSPNRPSACWPNMNSGYSKTN